MLYRDFDTTEALDAQYNLSTVVGDTSEYLSFYVDESERARARLDCQLDVSYGPTVEEKLDIFPADKPDAPIAFFIHGGYWRRFSAKDFSFVAAGLVAHGITVIVPDYALCPKVTLPEITRQCRAAVAWAASTSAQFNGDRNRIFVSGHSAGGHLTARVLCTDWIQDYGLPANTVKAGYAISGIYDLSPLRYVTVQAEVQLNQEIICRESPLLNIPVAAPPLTADVGAGESSEFRRQSRDFISAWQASGLEGTYIEQAGKNHFTAIDGFADPTSALCSRIVSMVNR